MNCTLCDREVNTYSIKIDDIVINICASCALYIYFILTENK